MTVTAIQRTCFRTSKGRCFFTLEAAVKREASDIISERYPAEDAQFDSIGMTDPGFHWRSMPRSDVLFRRLVRLIKASYLCAP